VLETLVAGVSGKGAHTDAERMLDGLDWRLAGRVIEGVPYTILQSANHIIFWNGYTLAHLAGQSPKPPEHAADGWPGPAAPGSEEEWTAFVRAYRASLDALIDALRARRFAEIQPTRSRTRIDVLRAMTNHVSYHAGQIALMRRMLGAWPPPGGGDTW
jgi:uncharacterized damage-inducible protein DinB